MYHSLHYIKIVREKGFYRQSSSKFTLLEAKLKQQKHITYTLLIYFSLKFIFLYLLNAIELDKLIYAMRCYLLFSRMFSILFTKFWIYDNNNNLWKYTKNNCQFWNKNVQFILFISPNIGIFLNFVYKKMNTEQT